MSETTTNPEAEQPSENREELVKELEALKRWQQVVFLGILRNGIKSKHDELEAAAKKHKGKINDYLRGYNRGYIQALRDQHETLGALQQPTALDLVSDVTEGDITNETKTS